MRRYLSEMNATLRGFLIIVAIVLAIIILNQQTALLSLVILARIAFFLAIAFFIYLLWRERRGEISTWPGRALFAFYGGAAIAIVAVGAFILDRPSGPDALAFFVTLALAAFSMFRVWRDQHTYG